MKIVRVPVLLLAAGFLFLALAVPSRAAWDEVTDENAVIEPDTGSVDQPVPEPVSSPVIIAIGDFENYAGDSRFDFMSKGIADAIVMKLQGLEGVRVVERTRFAEIMSELALGQSGLMNDLTVQKVGKSLAAGHMIVGGFEYNSLTRYLRINVRVVEVETGLISHSDTIIDAEQYADDLQQGIAEKLALHFGRPKRSEELIQATNVPDTTFGPLPPETNTVSSNADAGDDGSDEETDDPVFEPGSFMDFLRYYHLDNRELPPRKEIGDPSGFGDFIDNFSRSRK